MCAGQNGPLRKFGFPNSRTANSQYQNVTYRETYNKQGLWLLVTTLNPIPQDEAGKDYPTWEGFSLWTGFFKVSSDTFCSQRPSHPISDDQDHSINRVPVRLGYTTRSLFSNMTKIREQEGLNVKDFTKIQEASLVDRIGRIREGESIWCRWIRRRYINDASMH